MDGAARTCGGGGTAPDEAAFIFRSRADVDRDERQPVV
jgi:hypothetical protein